MHVRSGGLPGWRSIGMSVKQKKMLPAESATSCQRSSSICSSNCWSASILANFVLKGSRGRPATVRYLRECISLSTAPNTEPLHVFSVRHARDRKAYPVDGRAGARGGILRAWRLTESPTVPAQNEHVCFAFGRVRPSGLGVFQPAGDRVRCSAHQSVPKTFAPILAARALWRSCESSAHPPAGQAPEYRRRPGHAQIRPQARRLTKLKGARHA